MGVCSATRPLFLHRLACRQDGAAPRYDGRVPATVRSCRSRVHRNVPRMKTGTLPCVQAIRAVARRSRPLCPPGSALCTRAQPRPRGDDRLGRGPITSAGAPRPHALQPCRRHARSRNVHGIRPPRGGRSPGPGLELRCLARQGRMSAQSHVHERHMCTRVSRFGGQEFPMCRVGGAG